MRLIFKEKHRSIDQYNTIELPDFTVLTGVNGSGKSHLLESIKYGKSIIDDVKKENIVLFNYDTFKLEAEGPHNARSFKAAGTNAWDFFKQNFKLKIEKLRNNLNNDYNRIIEICKEKNKPLWAISKEDTTDKNLYENVQDYKKNISNLFDSNNMKKNEVAINIFILLQSLQYSIDMMDEEDFIEQFTQYSFKDDNFLPKQLGGIFSTYYARLIENELNDVFNKKDNGNRKHLTENEFLTKYGEKPWDVINKILSNFNSLEYKVNSPEETGLFDNYQLSLISTGTNKESVGIQHLSSGEQTLMALVATIYKQKSDNHFPDIILLDEIDASLHPSMMKNLLNVINDIFAEIKVILVTHSPTMIALSPEESIFIMNKAGNNRIKKSSREEAVEILSEGFITMEKGMKLFDQISKSKISLITEGANVEFIKKALELYGLTNIKVIDGIEHISSKSQLKTLFDFFSYAPHENKVIFAWDCDAEEKEYRKLKEQNNTIPFIFEKNHYNSIAETGIENLFPKDLFSNFINKTERSTGQVISKFDNKRKKDFLLFIKNRNDQNDFINFSPLMEKLQNISLEKKENIANNEASLSLEPT